MAVAVQQPQQRQEKDPLEVILRGLQIAQGVYGIKEAGDKAQFLAEQRQMQSEDRKFTQAAKEAELGSKGYQKQVDEETGAISFLRPPGYESLEDQLTKSVIAKNKADAARKETGDPLAKALAQERLDAYKAKKLEEEKKLAKQKIPPIPGYQKTDAYNASNIEEKDLRSGMADLSKFNNAMDSLIEKVQKTPALDLANPFSDASKAIKNDLRDLQLTYKGDAFAKLGVLTGPDLKLLEEIIESPNSISNLISGTPGVIERYKQAQQRVNDGFDARAGVYGLAKDPEGPALNISPLKKRQLQALVGGSQSATSGAGQLTPEMAQQELIRRQGMKARIPK